MTLMKTCAFCFAVKQSKCKLKPELSNSKITGDTMRLAHYLISIIFLVQLILLGCSKEQPEPIRELKSYSADDLSNIINLSRVTADSSIFTEGTGSIKIVATEPMVVKLYETGSLEIDDCRIIYQAKLKTMGLQGDAYLEMWCHFPGKGDFFSRAFHSKLSGDNDWSLHETLFMLQKGEKPDNVKLNLAVNGTGTVWIDEIKLLRVPLQ